MYKKKKANYNAPVIHTEFLENERDIELIIQVLGTFEVAGVAFGAVFYNDITDEINLHTFNMPKYESQKIYNEVISLPELNKYKVTLN
jgi:hypothetical protein